MRETKAYPKTSAPSPGDYLKAYKKVLQNSEKALVIPLSSKLSATYNSAREAKELMPDPSKIVIFDSLQAVAPEGFLTLKAAELIKQSKDIEEILKLWRILEKKLSFLAF